MQNAPSIYDDITDFLANNPAPQDIINYRLPAYFQERAHELLEKNGEGLLTAEEHKEMAEFRHIDHLLTLLKAKIRLKLKQASDAADGESA
jgi:hypothetical protein